MSSLEGIRKDLWNNGGFRMILKDTVIHRPEHLPFNPSSGKNIDIQIEEWKARSAEQRGFDDAFQFITGHKIIDLGDLK